MFTNAENLVKIGPVLSEIFSAIYQFLPIIPKVTVSKLMVNEPICIKFAHDIAKVLLFNLSLIHI